MDDAQIMFGGRALILDEKQDMVVPDIYKQKDELSITKEELFLMEAAILTILDMNRCQVTPEAKTILDEQFANVSLKYVLKNVNFLEEYGIIPPYENVMTGGVEQVVEQPVEQPPAKRRMSGRPIKPTPNVILGQSNDIEFAKQDLEIEAEKARKLKEISEKLKQEVPQQYEDLADYMREVVEGICNKNSASKLLKALFPKPSKIWMEIMKKDCRDVYEPSGIEIQCNNTIGKAQDSEIPQNNICYICGFGFNELNINGATFEEIEGLKPTCEHILPIIQAIFFLDLYRNSEKGLITPEKMELLKLEYAWAHQCCNYVKGDFSYLVTKLDGNKYPYWDFSPNSTNKILSNIYNTRKFAGTRIIQEKIGNNDISKNNWLQKQITSIGDGKMYPIVERIKKHGNGGIVALIGLGNCLDTSKISTHFLDVYNTLKIDPNWQPNNKRKRGGTRRKYGDKKTKRRSI